MFESKNNDTQFEDEKLALISTNTNADIIKKLRKMSYISISCEFVLVHYR